MECTLIIKEPAAVLGGRVGWDCKRGWGRVAKEFGPSAPRVGTLLNNESINT